ncbi:hypothetical protein [Actinoplanes utahensis]|nr:hypothetical protein [Actinoplanes utahensis]GIF31875.1 hypothetical protein Aut01nite_48610 [Actinoplanes utahensis]
MAVLSAALSALLILPCAATILLSGDPSGLRRLLTRKGRQQLRADNRERADTRHLAPRARRRVHRGPPSREERTWRRVDRSLRTWDPAPRLASLRTPPIEQLAYHLRRLDRQRRNGLATHSEVWLAAVMRGYDTRLQMACRCLDIPERLESLQGAERDLERQRVEALLEAAGLTLRC